MKLISTTLLLPILIVSASATVPQSAVGQRVGAEKRDNTSALATATPEKAAASVARSQPKSELKPDPLDANESAQRYYQQGLSLAEAGKLDEALVAFRESVRLRPDDVQANLSLGVTLARKKAFKEALDSFKIATRLKPDSAEAHFRLGITSHVLGKRNQAIDEYKKLQELKSPLANKLNEAISSSNLASFAEEIGADLSPLTTKPESSLSVNASPSGPTSIPTPTEKTSLTEIYRVGVGDVLDIRLLNSNSNRSTLFTVMPGGFIEVPVAGGAMAVAGLTLDEIQSRISGELRRRAVEKNSAVSVGIRQYVSHSVMVTGLVGNPGIRFLRRESVPLYVVLAEAQLRNDAGRVSILRGTSTQMLDLSDPATLNVIVQPGDVITLAGRPQEFYYIGGRINYSGQRPFQAGITLLQAILAAGGTRANENKAEISREGANGRLVTTKFSIKAIKAGTVEDPKLQAGDRIEIIR